MSPIKLAIWAMVAAVLVVGAGVCRWWLLQPKPEPKLREHLYAVYLDSGLVLYGRLEGLGSPFPVLREVYVAKSGLNLGRNVAVNAMGKRSYEIHKPAYTVINARHIRMVEPVAPDSEVANSIMELRYR
jgi:hypothetical protein